MIRGSLTIIDTETPRLVALRQSVAKPKAMNAAAGRRVERELRGHFLKKDRQGNRRGWARSHFWNRRIRTSTAFAGATDAGATVEISDPAIEQKIHGGTIRAKRSKFLALPLTEEAKMKGSPREWGKKELRLIVTPRGAFLMKRTTNAQGEKGGLNAMYKLKRSVTQDADPTALPAKGVLEAAVDDEAEKFYARQLARK